MSDTAREWWTEIVDQCASDIQYKTINVASCARRMAVAWADQRIAELQAEVERLREALVRIQDNPCSGHYGPCGAADMSVYIADEALTDQP